MARNVAGRKLEGRLTAREIAERELMKLSPRARAKFLRLMYALMPRQKKRGGVSV
jgi:hypothetical protein